MKKNTKEIPKMYSYLGEFMDELPSNVIFNKGICGCGGTTVELKSRRNSLILVPTINLVINKMSDVILGVMGGVPDTDILDYLKSDVVNKKIVCTYDSFRRVLDIIDPKEYFLLIDEYHLLFSQYAFRNTAVRFVLNNFRKFPKFCFLSATPLTEETMLTELGGIDILTYEWKGKDELVVDTVVTPQYIRAVCSRIDKCVSSDYNLHIFVNSVKTIKTIIGKFDELDFRTVCSPTNMDKSHVNYQGINSEVRKVNFYTSTAFEGADIFDENGKTIVISDTKIACTISDISTLIRQIAGRIRNSKYINRIEYILCADTHRYYNITPEKFCDFVQNNINEGNTVLSLYRKGTGRERRAITKKLNVTEVNKNYLNIEDMELFYDDNLRKLDITNYSNFKNLTAIYVNNPRSYYRNEIYRHGNATKSIYEDLLYRYIEKGVPYRKDILMETMKKNGIISEEPEDRFFTNNFSSFTSLRKKVDGKVYRFYTFY